DLLAEDFFEGLLCAAGFGAFVEEAADDVKQLPELLGRAAGVQCALHVPLELRRDVQRNKRGHNAQAARAWLEYGAGKYAPVALDDCPVGQVRAAGLGELVDALGLAAIDLVKQFAPALAEGLDV